ncbi:MAG: DUF4383 domain-containing protein, partial [Actinomycetota bacterium]|nr:DUF4383 domain-containing protein [Actinomycetota bacterium]
MSYEYWTETRNGGGTAVKTAKPKTAKPKTATSKPERATSGPSSRSHGRSLAQLFAAAIGAVFVLVGVVGFVPGIVRMFGDLSFIGPDSHAKLLGLFEISVVHNIVHLLFGVGLIASRKSAWAVRYLVIGGVA